MPDFTNIRQNMVKGQILPEGVMNPALIDALLTVPRERFFPRQLARIAYMDDEFPFNNDRALLRPSTLARLLDALTPTPNDTILYIAGGTGYGPALLGQMGITVVALDCEAILTQDMERLLLELQFTSVEVVLGALEEGWMEYAPYDKIIIEGSVEFIPKILASQIKEGGEIITFHSNQRHKNNAVRYVKQGSTLIPVILFDAFAPRLDAFQKKKEFVF